MCSADMGCGGNWLKKLTRLKKTKGCCRGWIKRSLTKKKSDDTLKKPGSNKSSTIFADSTCDSNGNRWVLGRRIEDVAASKIQKSFRSFRARKRLQQLGGIVRLKKIMAHRYSMKIQAQSALKHFHTYSEIQDQIKTRRLCMVIEDRLRQKKFENQLKVKAKLHEVETEWSCTPKSMDEIKAKIHYREEAAIKRERALSYAFNHQWRANASQQKLMGNSELGNTEWGWSWKERWIAARPWESHVVATSKNKLTTPTYKIGKTKVSSAPTKSSFPKVTFSSGKSSKLKRTLSNGKSRLYFPTSKKLAAKKDIKGEITKTVTS